MRFYFLSDRPCALKLGGIYVGRTGGAEKFMNIDPADGILCEFIPASEAYSPVTFIINDDFTPGERIKEYFLPNAVALYAHDFLFADTSLSLIKQEKYSDCSATLFAQGKVFASVENAEGIFTHALNESFLNGNIYRRENCIIFFSGDYLAVINVAGELLIFTPVISCSFSAALKAEIPLFDCLRHTAKAEWILSDKAERIKYEVSGENTPNAATAALALAEGLLYGFDISFCATDSLNKKITALKSFLGDYKEVICLGENVIGLAYKREDNAHTVIPFTADLIEGKVDNIKEFVAN